MKKLLILCFLLISILVIACSKEKTCKEDEWYCSPIHQCIKTDQICSNGLEGGSWDVHGCNPTTGNSWCEEKQKCLRVWEENCSQACSCPEGYTADGDACNPNCYYSTPKCLAHSIKCNSQNTGMANPASVYCEEHEGTIKIIDTEEGQQGICVLKDGTECDEWKYFRNECPVSEITNNQTSLTYQPMQCEETPWQIWYGEGHIQFFKEPTEKELITAYFINKYNIELISFEKLNSDKMICEACGVCPASYYYQIEVNKEDADKLKQEGWN